MRRQSGGGGGAGGARQSLSSALPGDLPPGWVRVESRSKPGAYYYAHTATGKTQVEKPVEKSARQKALASVLTGSTRVAGAQASSAPSVARRPEKPEAEPARPESRKAEQKVVELDEDPEAKKAEEEARKKRVEEQARKQAEAIARRKEEEDARRKKVEERRREEEARRKEAEEAEERAQEELRQKAMERRTAKVKQQVPSENTDEAEKDDAPSQTQAEEESRVSVAEIRRATMEKDWTRRKQKKKAWKEEDDSDDDEKEVTQEDIEKWREDEERREREAIEAKRKAVEDEKRRIVEEKLEKERKIREAAEEAIRQKEEEERRIVEEELERARLIAEAEEEKKRQKEEGERMKHVEALEKVRREAEEIETKRRQKEEEERMTAEAEKERVRLQAEQEDNMRLKKEEDELKKQEEALERTRREAEHKEALRKRREEFTRMKEQGLSPTPSMVTGMLEPDAKRQRQAGEDNGRSAGTIIWYNGRRRCGVIAQDWDGKRLRIAAGGAPNGGLAPPVPGGLMHGTRVNFNLAANGPGQDPVCFDVVPIDGQAGLSCGGDSQAGARYQNEDRTVAVDLPEGLGHVVGLFDGHRGTACADFLTQNLSKTIIAKVQEGFNEWLAAGRAILSLSIAEEIEVIRSGLIAAFEDCDRNFLWSAQQNGWGDGSSAIVTLITHGFEEPGKSTVYNAIGGQAKCFVAWCGLGRVLLLRGSQVMRVTRDHTCAEDAEWMRLETLGALMVQDPRGVWWMGRPDRQDLARHRQQGYEDPNGPKTFLAASRGFGDVEIKRLPYRTYNAGMLNTPILTATPEVSVVDLCPQDWAIVMIGRGVSNVLSDKEVADVCIDAVVTKGQGPVEAAQTLTARAKQRGSKDNLTCIMMRLGWAQPPQQRSLAELLTAKGQAKGQAKGGYG